LIEKTVEIAAATKKFGDKQLRAALDSSPLWGATKNLLALCPAFAAVRAIHPKFFD
jgi:hypothetical protein